MELDVHAHSIPLREKVTAILSSRVLAGIGVFKCVVEVVATFCMLFGACNGTEDVEFGGDAVVYDVFGQASSISFVVAEGQ